MAYTIKTIGCPCCNRTLSSKAHECPACGHVLVPWGKRCGWFTAASQIVAIPGLIVLAVGMLVALITLAGATQ